MWIWLVHYLQLHLRLHLRLYVTRPYMIHGLWSFGPVHDAESRCIQGADQDFVNVHVLYVWVRLSPPVGMVMRSAVTLDCSVGGAGVR